MQLYTILNLFGSLASIALASPVSFNIAEVQTESGVFVGHAAHDRPEEYLRRGSAGNFTRIPTLLDNTDYEQGFYKLQYSAQHIYFNESVWAAIGQRLATCSTAQSAKWRSKQALTWRYRYFGQYQVSSCTVRMQAIPLMAWGLTMAQSYHWCGAQARF